MPSPSLPAPVLAHLTAPVPTTTPTPAPHESTSGGGLVFLLLLLLLLWGIGYAISVLRYPLRTCRRCDGTGLQHSAWFSHAMRVCPRCRGTRRELRPGARRPTGRGHNPRA
ncbi:hypothetical protein [Actinomadura hibisca]|uniref:hypothetical protein n=1 Tax=Actinomadura hibisca TaxID=68565 RepID=UPI00082AC76C|nr:hypothetical protein [Actinomadura hibisca]